MRKILLFGAFFNFTALSPLFSLGNPSLQTPSEGSKLVINNRVLAKINGKAISVMDVTKKLDLFFYKQFPQYIHVQQARYQFHTANWKAVLKELIDKELILADAEENKVPVSNGDVRQEMETLFGPNIHATLDKMGMTYEEAWKMVHNDIKIRRMLFARVNNKALAETTPQVIRTAYDKYAAENKKEDEWRYQVVSVRDPDQIHGAEVASRARALLDNGVSLSELPEAMKSGGNIGKASISLTEELQHSPKEISEAYRNILSTMDPGTFTQPIQQKSRKDSSTLYRIFYLKEILRGGIPSFPEMSDKIKNKLLDEASAKESILYLDRLRKKYGIQEEEMDRMFDENFHPYGLR